MRNLENILKMPNKLNIAIKFTPETIDIENEITRLAVKCGYQYSSYNKNDIRTQNLSSYYIVFNVEGNYKFHWRYSTTNYYNLFYYDIDTDEFNNENTLITNCTEIIAWKCPMCQGIFEDKLKSNQT